MFDLAATAQSPTSATPSALSASLTLAMANAPAANPESPAVAGDTSQPGMFQALLALQTAPAPVMPNVVPVAAAPTPPVRQPGGKPLPDAAIAVAAEPDPVALSPDDTSTSTDDLAAASPPALSDFALPDFALIAAIFAAPQRQAASPEAEPEQPGPAEVQQLASNPRASASPAAATLALAQSAQIELDPVPAPRTPAAPAAAPPALTRATQVERDQRLAPRAPDATAIAATAAAPIAATAAAPTAATTTLDQAVQIEPADRPVPLAPAAVAATAQDAAKATGAVPVEQPLSFATVDIDELQASDEAQDPAQPALQNAAPAAPQQDDAPASRAETRAERIDFATLVETLSRAREDASPNAVRASVQHADFGRVSLRFEQDDTGAMSVAMSSADPGFARAVTASSDAASTQSQPDTPRGQPSQNPTTSQGEGSRQQPGSRQSQPARQPGEAPRRDDPTTDSSGIFA